MIEIVIAVLWVVAYYGWHRLNEKLDVAIRLLAEKGNKHHG